MKGLKRKKGRALLLSIFDFLSILFCNLDGLILFGFCYYYFILIFNYFFVCFSRFLVCLRSIIFDVTEDDEGFLGGDLGGGVGGAGGLVLFVMLEGVEDSESFGMLVRFWGWVSFDMLGGFWESLLFVMLVLLAGSVAICMLGGIERSVGGIERTVASGRLGEIEG